MHSAMYLFFKTNYFMKTELHSSK